MKTDSQRREKKGFNKEENKEEGPFFLDLGDFYKAQQWSLANKVVECSKSARILKNAKA